jgi:regulatory protein
MSKITRLVKAKTREKRVKIYLDGRYAFTLLTETILKEGLRTGQELTAAQVEALTGKDRFQRSLNTAVRLLGYRPRSEAEIRQHLQRHGFDEASTAETLAILKDRGLVDDVAFARFWIENRESFRPRSQRLAGLELRRKGLSDDIIRQVTGEIDERESAYRAAQARMRHLATKDDDDFRRRLGGYLARRGFGYEIIEQTINRIKREPGDTGQRLPAHTVKASGVRRAGLRRSSPIRKELTVR